MAQDPLVDELMKRGLPLDSRIGAVSIAPEDFATQTALRLLRENGFDVRTPRLVDKLPYKSNPGSKPLAFVDLNQTSPEINVLKDSDIYKKASRNDPGALIALAGILAHENHHLQHGSEEYPAYDAQIAALKALGANRKLLEQVLSAQRLTKGSK